MVRSTTRLFPWESSGMAMTNNLSEYMEKQKKMAENICHLFLFPKTYVTESETLLNNG